LATVVALVRVLQEHLVAHVVRLVVVTVEKAHVVFLVLLRLHHLVEVVVSEEVHAVVVSVEAVVVELAVVAKCRPSTSLVTLTSIP
jgi:hypothetical protein